MRKVSVVMPAYNAEKYIAESIKSLLEQTFDNWELIVVDDGSEDETLAVVQSFPDARIRVISQENRGEAGARNTGLRVASGQYIAFLDADDMYLPDGLASFVHYMDSHPDVDVVYSDGYIGDVQAKPLMRLTEIRPYIHEGFILDSVVVSSVIITVPLCTMLRRTVVETHAIWFDEQLGYGTDWDFWIRLARHAQFGYLDALTCLYRVHQTNMTRSASLKKRRFDLLAGRLKVWNADWFHNLPAYTRHIFTYNLVMELLADEPEKQKEILESDVFQNLPAATQSHMCRSVSGAYIVKGEQLKFALSCLQQAVQVNPADRKALYMMRLTEQSPILGRTVLQTWHQLQQIQQSVRSIGKQKPKSVPLNFGPVIE